MESPDQLKSELETFRQKWLTDLQTKDTSSRAQAPRPQADPSSSGGSSSAAVTASKASKTPAPRTKAHLKTNSDDLYGPRSFDGPVPAVGRTPGVDSESVVPPVQQTKLVSALDHFELAVEKEAQGNLGDSLSLYRKAFRLDSGVDQQYRKKYFPPSSASGAVTTPRAGGPAQTAAQTSSSALPINDLIYAFAGLHIAPATPEIEGDPLPPCPIAKLPREILSHILRDVAILDVGDFARSALVCKTFAYIVATEEPIWRRVCLGSEFGFAAMHYSWQKDVTWGPLPSTPDESGSVWMSDEEKAERAREENLLTTRALLPILYSSSWKNMFRHRPRIRFNGCYICTVNYIRSGQASTNQVTWNSPVHIVTYYRYLRFFRDGTVLSLVTVAEPSDVVHYLTRELAALHRDGSSTHLPSAVVQLVHRGRWYISPFVPPDDDTHEPADLAMAERNLYIETEGAVPKYVYRMDLALQSAGKTTRNNKLAWRGFYSYNRLTDDWAEFGLRHDKPFFFSRVKSYGTGE